MAQISFSLPSSFRDPSGFLFFQKGILYRQVNLQFKDHYDYFVKSGLYSTLCDTQNLIPHEEISFSPESFSNAYKILKPRAIPFISYPYEWCFSQLRDAALVTMDIQKTAISHGMTLKDATAFNIQFHRGRPIFIDTLSFEIYSEGDIWKPYRQFCQHFLAPLALMSYADLRLGQLLRTHLDGIPLDLASKLLPFHTKLRFGLLSHIHVHSKAPKHFSAGTSPGRHNPLHRNGLLRIIDSLVSTVKGLPFPSTNSVWSGYYQENNYSDAAMDEKLSIVEAILKELRPKSAWDLGANNGRFSLLAADLGIEVIAFDSDPRCVESHYQNCTRSGERRVLPLLTDLTNPSPNLGWAHEERISLIDRGPAEVVMALALIHHLAISNNVPFARLAEFFKRICASLIIEFVPKEDSQTKRLLATRPGTFPQYTVTDFVEAFTPHFTIEKTFPIKHSQRTLFLMRKKE